MAMLPIGDVQGMPQGQPELLTLATLLLAGIVTWGICLLVAVFQLPGLARRDVQDRSIERWLSLPGGMARAFSHAAGPWLAGAAGGPGGGHAAWVPWCCWWPEGELGRPGAWPGSQVLAVLPPLWLRPGHAADPGVDGAVGAG